jgi:hypothetical protein
LGRALGIGVIVVVVLMRAAESSQSLVAGAEMRGTVRDAAGQALDDASVVAISSDTGLSRSARTDGDGRYIITGMAPGPYRVSATFGSLRPQLRETIVVLLGQFVSVDFVLLPTATAELIVTPETAVVEVDRTGVSSVIQREQIDGLPINGRNFMSFAALTPGVTLTEQARPGAETSGLSFMGQRPDANNLMVDGADHNDRIQGGALASLSQDAVREFQVLANGYAAEFGEAAAGVVNIVTRSGTNRHLGDLFFFHRNEHLNAKDHFEQYDIFDTPIDRTKAPYRQYQWGATAGGPLQRDRAFYFLALERLDIDASNFVNIDSAAATVLSLGGFPVELGHVPYTLDTTQVTAKLSQQWTATRSLTVSAHVSDVTNENFRSYGGITARSHGVAQLRNDWALSAAENDVWGTGWLNEARGQFAHQSQNTQALDPRCGGPCTTELQGGPEVTIPGVAILGRNIYEPTARTNWRVQLADVVSYASGGHLFKAGASFTALDQEARTPLEFGGSFTFAPLPAIPGVLPAPISAMQAFALGLPALYVQGYGNSSGPFTYREMSGFAQDDWRVTPRLTLKAGVRYQTQLWPASETTVSNVGGTVFRYPFPQDRDNIAPRIAASFDFTGHGRTAIDGAYGVFYGNQLASILGSQIVFDGSPDGVRLLVLPLPQSVAAWQTPDHRIAEPPVGYPSSVVTVAPDMKSPYSHQASFGVSHAFSDGLFISVSIAQVDGRRQIGSLNYNPFVPELGAGRRPNDVAGIPGTSADVFQFTDFGSTRYRGLLVSARQRIGQRYDFLVSYTLSKAQDNSSALIGQVEDNGAGRNSADPTGLPLHFSADREHGPADSDRRHRLVLSGSYRWPGDVHVAAIVGAASARPFTPLAGADMNGDGLPFADRARTNPFDSATSVGRNSERMNAEAQVDLRVSKRVALGGQAGLEVLLDVFNVFNRTNFAEVNNVFGPGPFPEAPLRDSSGRVTYGRFVKAQAPRQVQLGARLRF